MAEAIDWRAVLVRYLAIVGENEGVDFLYERQWTPDIWLALQQAREEADAIEDPLDPGETP